MPDKFLDDDALQQLSAYARAQEASNQIEQRQLQAMLRRETILLDIAARTEQLGAEVRALVQCVRERNLADDSIREFFVELSEQFERFERNQILLLTEHSHAAVLDAISETTAGDSSQRRLMRQYIKNYNRLREQAAIYGADVPLDLLNKIEKASEDIKNLKQEMS